MEIMQTEKKKNGNGTGRIVAQNIPDDLPPRLKAGAALKGLTIGQAVTQAVEMWLAHTGGAK
jgi:hypothetical protein